MHNMSYCYLNQVWVDDNDNGLLYELVFSDKNFRDVYFKRVNKESLISTRNENKYEYNFKFKDDYLCCPDVKRLKINNIIMESKDKEIRVNSVGDDFNLYAFLTEAIDNGYIFVSDEFIQEHSLQGLGYTGMHNIRFSRTTMSVYVQIINVEGIHNEMIVSLEGTRLVFHPFYVAVPINKKLSYGAVKKSSCNIEHVPYDIYYVDFLSLYTKDDYIAYGLINRACAISAQCLNMCKILDTFIEAVRCVTENGVIPSQIAWAGGSSSHKSSFGVLFKSSIKILSNKEVADIVNKAVNHFLPMLDKYNFETLEDKIKMANHIISITSLPTITKWYYFTLLKVILNANTMAEQLSVAIETKKACKTQMLFCDVYMYRIRSYSYLNCVSLVNLMRPVITDLSGIYTEVKEGLYYGDYTGE